MKARFKKQNKTVANDLASSSFIWKCKDTVMMETTQNHQEYQQMFYEFYQNVLVEVSYVQEKLTMLHLKT